MRKTVQRVPLGLSGNGERPTRENKRFQARHTTLGAKGAPPRGKKVVTALQRSSGSGESQQLSHRESRILFQSEGDKPAP